MGKKRLLVLGVIAIVAVLIFFIFSKFTGEVTNETLNDIECNIADLNLDGEVNYLDRTEFGKLYEPAFYKEDYCGQADINEDGVVDFLDSNAYVVIFEENYGVVTGPCVMRKLSCQEEESETDSVVELDELPGGELSEEELSFFQKIINFFKNLFKK